MATMSARQLRRKLRNAMNVRRWTLRQKIGIGIWIPVLVVAFALFTGPSRPSDSASADSGASTTTTFKVTVPTLQPLVPAALSLAPKTSLHDRVVKWIKGVPPKRSRAEKLALLRYNQTHTRGLLAKRNATPRVVIVHGARAHH